MRCLLEGQSIPSAARGSIGPLAVPEAAVEHQLSRRACTGRLVALVALPNLLGRAVRAQEPAALDADPAAAAVARAALRRAGLTPVPEATTPTYLVLGDAPAAFLDDVGRLCDDLAADLIGHFQKRGFAVQPPKERLVVVALSGPKAYASYLGIAEDQAIGGQYDPASNVLVMFDNRGRDQAVAAPLRANTVALLHEATHQLTFNIGLLDRARAVPLAVSEGLATYGESRRPDGSLGVGDLNRDRQAVFAIALAQGQAWIPLRRLIAEDDLFLAPDSRQLAYAESWLWTHTMMGDSALLQRYRSYVERLLQPEAPADRLQLAGECLGGLDDLDAQLKRRANALLRK